jgi:hypothetical protein
VKGNRLGVAVVLARVAFQGERARLPTAAFLLWPDRARARLTGQSSQTTTRMSTRRRSSKIRYTMSPCPAGPKVRARMGLFGLLLWYGAPFQGATSSAARASANGASASAGSASTCCCDWSSVVTVYNAATGPAGP